MISFASIRSALYNVVSTELDVVTIWADQSEVRPPRPYASMKLIAGPVVIANDEVRQPSTGVFAVAGLRQLTLSVNAFGEGAMEMMSRLQTALSKDSVADTLAAYDIAVTDVGAVQNLTTLLENRYETRAQMDIRFYVSENENDSVTFIDSVEVTSEPDSDTDLIEA